MEEEMFLGLRKMEGISISHFEEKFNRGFDQVYGQIVTELIQEQMLKRQSDRLMLTDKGLILGNNVFERFLIEK